MSRAFSIAPSRSPSLSMCLVAEDLREELGPFGLGPYPVFQILPEIRQEGEHHVVLLPQESVDLLRDIRRERGYGTFRGDRHRVMLLPHGGREQDVPSAVGGVHEDALGAGGILYGGVQILAVGGGHRYERTLQEGRYVGRVEMFQDDLVAYIFHSGDGPVRDHRYAEPFELPAFAVCDHTSSEHDNLPFFRGFEEHRDHSRGHRRSIA